MKNIQYLPTLRSKIIQIAFIKSYSLKEITRLCPNSPIIFIFDLKKFSMKVLFNIQSFLYHKSKHYETNSVHQGLSKNTKSVARSTTVWEILR